jgi:hypothetical protein
MVHTRMKVIKYLRQKKEEWTLYTYGFVLEL